MSIIQIEQLTVSEKIQFMESLWDSLCKDSKNITTPVWHGAVLDDRVSALSNQTDQFVDWEEAKLLIRQKVL